MGKPKGSSKSGILTILALFVFGGIFVGGLYLTTYLDVPAEYRASKPGVPSGRLRFVSCDLKWQKENLDSIIDKLRQLHPDYIFLQRTLRKTAQDLAIALDMRSGGELQMYSSPSEGDQMMTKNNAILARHALYKGRAMPKDDGVEFGVWVESIIEGKRFLIGSVDMEDGGGNRLNIIEKDWKKSGAMPLVIGGKFPELSSFGISSFVKDPFAAPLSRRYQYILVTSHWHAQLDQPATTQPASDLLYMDLEPAK